MYYFLHNIIYCGITCFLKAIFVNKLNSIRGTDEGGGGMGVGEGGRRCCCRPQNKQICVLKNADFFIKVPKAA